MSPTRLRLEITRIVASAVGMTPWIVVMFWLHGRDGDVHFRSLGVIAISNLTMLALLLSMVPVCPLEDRFRLRIPVFISALAGVLPVLSLLIWRWTGQATAESSYCGVLSVTLAACNFLLQLAVQLIAVRCRAAYVKRWSPRDSAEQ